MEPPKKRTVRVVEGTPLRGPVKLWAYGYRELAKLLGMKEAAVRQAVRRGKLHPGTLRGVVTAWTVRSERRGGTR